MKVIKINPIEDLNPNPIWTKLLAQYDSDVFHSPGWMKSIIQTYNFEISAFVVVDDDGEPMAGVAYCEIQDMMDCRIVSLPFSDFCDPLVKTKDQWNMLVEELLKLHTPLTFKCLHNAIPLDDERVPMTGRDKWHCIDLKKDVESLWNSFHSSGRRAIRKAKKNGITVRIGETKEDLEAFFNMHLRIRKYKYHLVAQPYEFFENIWNNFMEEGNGALFLAYHEEKVIGGIFALVWNNRFYYKFNASDVPNVNLRPNDLMVWEASQYGIQKGYDYLDFGLSSWDQEGLIRYKSKFASEEKTVSFLKHSPNGGWSAENQMMRTLLPQLTDLFIDPSVPDEITAKAGNILYRYFC